MYTLSQMVDDLRLRINQSSTGSNLVWEDSELQTYCKDGVFFVLDHGRYDLVQSAFTRQLNLESAGGGLFLKPDDYYRFWAAEIDGVWVHELKELSEQKFIEGNDKLKGNTNRKYIYDYSGTTLEVRPTASEQVTLHYMEELKTTDFNSDSSTSPLTNTGDRYALQYAHGLVLQSKLFKPDVAMTIFNQVEKYIK